MTSNILVTGGNGFTGSNLVDRLLSKGHNVVSLDSQKGYSDEIEKNGAEVVEGSITDRTLVNKIMKDIDIVFHVAAAFRKISDPKKHYYDVNVNGTKILLESALKYNVERFIHCSTCGVHGEVREIPADENAPINPGDYYQYTKNQGETLAQEFFRTHEIKGVIIRPAAIYGPRDTRLLKLFKSINDGKFIMLGNGKTLYHLLYIDNLLDAFELAMDKEESAGSIYLIADEEYVSLERLVGEIAKTLGVPFPKRRFPVIWPVQLAGLFCEVICNPLGIEPPIFRRRVDFFKKDRAFDISKAKIELGYNPKVSFEEGIRRTAEWYKNNNLI